METNKELAIFHNDLQQRVIGSASSDDEGSMLAAAFTAIMLEELEEAGEIDEWTECYYRAHGQEVSGYGYGHDGDTLDLFVTRYYGGTSLTSFTRTDADALISRAKKFFERACSGLYRKLEESSPAFDMAFELYERRDYINQVRYFVLTDGILRVDLDLRKQSMSGRHVINVWDIQRLYRLHSSGQRQEPIHIDLVSEFGEAIPCLSAPKENQDYDAYLAILPGKVLYTLYDRFGSRLMELNVRSFLQARGKVNRGIRDTIMTEPGRFLAYNNGITATASELALVQLPNGGQGIATIDNLQIVNGGQTTASIHQAARRDKASIDDVYVQAKIAVPKAVALDDLVPVISRYANSQNKVDEADFSANDPFHLEIEKWSRIVWAAPKPGTQRQTRWFYERARGQYQVELSKQSTPAKRRDWQKVHPPTQRFSKTDLAKYLNTWDQLPHLVSLGGQKNFREFTLRLHKHMAGVPDQQYFYQLIAKAILFKSAEKIVAAERFGGYRANIVTYTLAYLARYAAPVVELDRVWSEQMIRDDVADAIRLVSQRVHDVIVRPPGGGNVTEWCKKEACWNEVKALGVDLSKVFTQRLPVVDGSSVRDAGNLSLSELATVAEAADVSSRTWYEVSVWANQTNQLMPWQRNLAMSLSSLAAQSRKPSIKQATQGLKLLKQARELGFVEAEMAADD